MAPSTIPTTFCVKALADLVGDDQRTLPGFYDELVELSYAERERFDTLPVNETV